MQSYTNKKIGGETMLTKEEFINLNGQWAYVSVPANPNGYAVFLIGGSIGFVSENSTDWHENPFKTFFLSSLTESGYTIAYSNTHGGLNWGNTASIQDVHNLYNYLLEHYNINHKVHIFSISSGGILTLRLMTEKTIPIRSVAFSQPLLNFKGQRQYEQEIGNDDSIGLSFAKAHSIPIENLNEYFEQLGINNGVLSPVPCKIWHGTGDKNVPVHINALYFVQLRLTHHLPVSLDVQPDVGHDPQGACYSNHFDIIKFFKTYE